MVITRRQQCVERWDERFDEIFEAAQHLPNLEVLMSEFRIRPREQRWFREWILTRDGHPPMTPKMRRHTSLHEAAHAVFAEILLPGVVAQAACYREQRQNPNPQNDGYPHPQHPWLRGTVDYFEDVCNGFFEKNRSEYLARKIAVTQSAGVVEKKCGYQNGRGVRGDENNVKRYLALAESETEREWIARRASELVASLNESWQAEQAMREVADRLYRDEVVSDGQIRTVVAGIMALAPTTNPFVPNSAEQTV